MNLGLDIDGTITTHPEVFLFLAKAWVAAGGELHIITARLESDREFTVRQLDQMGFNVPELAYTLHMYPHVYNWPFTSVADEHFTKRKHAEWKAYVCRQYNIAVLYDDCPHNIKAVSRAGVPTFHVTSHSAI